MDIIRLSFPGMENHCHARHPKVSLILCPCRLSSSHLILAVPPAQAPTASSFVQSVTSEESYEESYPSARVLFDFTPTSAFELDVSGAYISPVEN